MTRSKQIAKIRPNGPEDKFKGKVPEAEPFQAGSRNTVRIKTSDAIILNVKSLRVKPSKEHDGELWHLRPAVEDFDLTVPLELGADGVSILVGRLSEVYDEQLNVPGKIALISEPERVQATAVNRVTYLRGGLERELRKLEEANDLLESVKNPNPMDTLTGYTVGQIKRRIEGIVKEIHAIVRKIEILKGMLAKGELTHLLHVRGSAVFSSTHAVVSIRNGELTFIPLQIGWGSIVDSQNYELGRSTPPHDVRVSIEFPK